MVVYLDSYKKINNGFSYSSFSEKASNRKFKLCKWSMEVSIYSYVTFIKVISNKFKCHLI